MLIAQKKKQENIAEYILYMFQLEDIMRACSFDIAVVEKNIVSKFDVGAEKMSEIASWYNEMILAMKDQGIEKNGHLNYLVSLISELSAFNISMLQKDRKSDYSKAFSVALPALTEIVQKSQGNVRNEIDACFTLLYGAMVMRMRGQEISEDTNVAVEQVAQFIRLLAKEYHELDKQND